ncbi:MAG TPA: class I SAM-dependent methyltransferase [Ktedonobacterales bacterium]
MRTVRHNKVCEFEDFADPELAATIREVFPHEMQHFTPEFPKGAEYRKYWEVAMSVRAMRHCGILRPDAQILGVGAGTETTIFFLTNHVQRVVATDLYVGAGGWDQSAPWRMLVSPDAFAPYPYHRERLIVQHMDGRRLFLPDDAFDAIFSSGSIEHFGSMQSIASAAYEMGRVLRPGGVLTLSTEYRIRGPEGADGWDGLRFFSREALQRYIAEASGLEPIDEFDDSISVKTMASTRPWSFYGRDSRRALRAQGKFPRIAEVVWSAYPHLVLEDMGYTWGSVHLALRKTDRYPSADNDWAKPSAELLTSIAGAEGGLRLGAGSPGFVRRNSDRAVRLAKRGMRRAATALKS